MICALVAAPPSSAGLRQRIVAANKVERKLTLLHPRYLWVAACSQPTATRFDCRFVGRRGARGARGRATVIHSGRFYVVRLGRIAFS